MSAIGLGLLLGGCAAGAGGSRPVLGLDGQTLDASDPVERGRALILTGQYGLAIEGLNEVVTRDRGNARAFSLLAVAYAQLKRFDLADRYHAQALEIDPGSVVALNNWGYSYLVRGDGDRAAGLLARAAATNDHRPIVTANLALARGNDAEKPPSDAAAGGGDPLRSIQVSPHVILVRPTARLRRVAPGVQMLLTIDPAETPKPALVSLAPALVSLAPVAPPSSIEGDTESTVTTEQRLFQALFDLMEDPQPLAVAALGRPSQVAGMSPVALRPLLGTVLDIDDFTRL